MYIKDKVKYVFGPLTFIISPFRNFGPI